MEVERGCLIGGCLGLLIWSAIICIIVGIFRGV
jgi:hypothetical protein